MSTLQPVKPVGVSMPQEWHAALRKRAAKANMSMSEYIRHLILRDLPQKERQRLAKLTVRGPGRPRQRA